MIRDPSDGSVREAPKGELLTGIAPLTLGPDTSIRQPARTDAQERLERSREWLKNYYAKRGVSHADGGNDGKERSAAGDFAGSDARSKID